jgi:hypothetical protein
MDEIYAAIAEVQQPRSRFQLERFVLGQHATIEMQYYQTCLELQDMFYKYESAKLTKKITEIKIAKLRATGDEVDELKAQKLELGMRQTDLGLIGAEREIAHLIDIWKSFEHKYTREEIETAQPDYWKARLTANAEAMVLGQGTVNPAHIEAMAQAGALEEYLEQKRISGDLRNLES